MQGLRVPIGNRNPEGQLKTRIRLGVLVGWLLLAPPIVIVNANSSIAQGAGGNGVVPAWVSPALVHRLPLEKAPRAPQHVRFVYAIPSDAVDRRLDVEGGLKLSIRAMNNWVRANTNGQQFRIVDRNGLPELLFVRLDRRNEDMQWKEGRVLDQIKEELQRKKLIVPTELVLAFYDGTSRGVCGQAQYVTPPFGGVAAMFLNGTVGPNWWERCELRLVRDGREIPGQFEFGMAHELFHLMGAVPICAPHFVPGSHVSHDPTDLMFLGQTRNWSPAARIDAAHAEYYGHGRKDCPDVANSPYLTR